VRAIAPTTEADPAALFAHFIVGTGAVLGFNTRAMVGNPHIQRSSTRSSSAEHPKDGRGRPSAQLKAFWSSQTAVSPAG
jgi:hypothetical protein